MNNSPSLNNKGFTMLEVIIALLIFSGVSVLLLKAVSTADRIRGKGARVVHEVILGENETERIKAIAGHGDRINDTVYTSQLYNSEYTVERKILSPLLITPDSLPDLYTLEIKVSPVGSNGVPITFRLVQGYNL